MVGPANDMNVGPDIEVNGAWTVGHLNLPPQRIARNTIRSWPHLRDLVIPETDASQVTILLGADVLDAVLQHEVRRGAPGQTAQYVPPLVGL